MNGGKIMNIKKVISVFLIFAVLFVQSVITAQADKSVDVTYEEVIENPPINENIIAQTDNVYSEGFDRAEETDTDEEIREEEYLVREEEKKSSGRYIVKYSKKSDRVLRKLEKAAQKALDDGRERKAEKERQRIEKFSSASEEQKNQLKYKDTKNEYSTFSVGSDISINDFNEVSDDVNVIELSDSVSAEDFVHEVAEEMGNSIEYIQPDYILSLSAESENTITIELEGTDDDVLNANEAQEEAETNASEEPVADFDIPEETSQPENTEEPGNTEEPENTEETGNTEEPENTENPDAESANEIDFTDDAPQDRLYNIDEDLEAAWKVSRGDGAVIALIDTGVDINHPDIVNNVISGWNFCNDTSDVYNSELGLEQAHGTHIAGILAKTAPEAQIMPLKVFENGQAYTSDIIRAIDYAKSNGATVVNCSFGSKSDNPALREAIENSGLLFVCAAGNERTNIDIEPVYPAAYDADNVISVAALNQDLGMSYFSNYGAENVDIAAWGRDVYSCFPNGEYGTMNGTSMAAAYVTGAAALIASDKEPTSIKEMLMNTSDKLSCLDGKVKNGNKINFYGAVNNIIASDEYVTITPEDDFDVNGYQRTPEEDWELFSSSKTVQISAGNGFTLALKDDGTVWAWGDNHYGQLGNNTYADSSYPVQVIGLKNIISISAGGAYSLALCQDGSVWSWGQDRHNCLGDLQRYIPNVAGQICGLSDIRYISASHNESSPISIAVTNNSQLYAWGYNEFGEITDDSYSWYGISTPTLVTRIDDKVDKAVGGGGIYVLTENNDILDLNSTFFPDDTMMWQYIGINVELKLSNVKDITHHNRALKTDNTLVSWGLRNESLICVPDAPILDFNDNYRTWIAADNEGTIYTDKGNTNIVLNPVNVDCDGNIYYALTSSGEIWKAEVLEGVLNWKPLNLMFSKTGKYKLISSGDNHTIYVNTDGTVSAYGDNKYGQLGDGTTVSQKTGVKVSELENIAEVAAGNNFSLALDIYGNVYSWGRNEWWRLLGNESTESFINKPTKIQGLNNIIKIAANNEFALALDEDGNIYSWDSNSNGQLGVGSTETTGILPGKIEGLPKMVDIACGKFHSLAVDENGVVWAWGSNNNYKLGLPESGNITVPTQTAISNICNVSAGKNHSLAIDREGTVYAWGNNSYGQLGVDVETVAATYIAQMVALSSITEIITTYNHNIAIKDNGTVYSWGDNTCGQLGVKTEETYCSVPTEINSIAFSDISVNGTNTYGVYNDKLYKIGLMADMVSFDGKTNTPVKIETGIKFTQVEANRNSAVALDKFGNVYTWGDGAYYDLGHGEDKSNVYYPKKVEGLPKIKSIAKGKHHTLALDESGNIWGWGNNSSSEISANLKGKVYVPSMLSEISNVRSISAGDGFSAAIKNDGTVWTWGNNGSGQLGAETANSSPRQVPILNNVNKISCGDSFMLALQGTTIYAWGNNNSGQLGDETTVSHISPTSIPGEYRDISAGREFVLAISTDNKLYSWGRNSVGQLGLNDKNNRSTPTQVKGMLPDMMTCFAAYSHSLAISQTGELYSWGEGRSGQMGNNSATTSRLPVKVNSLSGIKDAVGGNDFSVAIDRSGALYTFGANTAGQLGIISYEPINITEMYPTEANELEVTEFTLITSGEIYNIVLTGKNISDPEVEFGFEYNANDFELVDAVGHTYDVDTLVGQVKSSDINILECEPGTIRFRKETAISFNDVYSGFINMIKLKAKTNSETEIKFVIY